jgi:hypothetical protein
MTPSMAKAKGAGVDDALAGGAPGTPLPVPSDRRLAPRVLVDLEVDYASEDN